MYYGWVNNNGPTVEPEMTLFKKIMVVVVVVLTIFAAGVVIPTFAAGGEPIGTKEAIVTSKSQSENRGSTSSYFYVEVEGQSKFFNVGNTVYTTFEVGETILVTEYSLFGGLFKATRYGTPENNNQIVKVPKSE